MTNRALIQSRIYKGYGKAAVRLGDEYQFYRYIPLNRVMNEDGTAVLNEDGSYALNEAQVGSSDRLLNEDGSVALNEDGSAIANEDARLPGISPLTNPTRGSWFVSLNAEDMKYSKPNKYGRATWYALFDATGAQVGDYFVGPQGTFFIATLQPLLPVLVVECNRVIDVIQPQTTTGAGIQPYSGNTATNQVTVMSQWPASILQGTKGEKTDAKLPGDTRAPWWQILLPYCPGVSIEFGMLINDDLSRSYTVSSAELSDMGWRLTCMQNVT